MRSSDLQNYRRGTILGLTLAEVILLVVFCLLLVFNRMIVDKNKDLERLTSNMDKQQHLIDVMSSESSLVEKSKELITALGVNDFDEAFTEIELLQKEKKSLNNKVNALTEKQQLLTSIEELLAADSTLNKDDIKDILLKNNKLAESIRETVGNAVPINELNTVLEKIIQDKENLKGQVAYLNKKMNSKGRGTEKPACWATASGKPEYIFQIELTSNGFVLHPNSYNHRKISMSSLPVTHIIYDQEVKKNTFRQSTQGLYDWSVDNECRFFVKVFDMTTPEEKKIYKEHLRIVGEHFYYYEPVQESPEWLSAL